MGAIHADRGDEATGPDLVSITFETDADTIVAMTASLASVCDALVASRDAREHVVQRFPGFFHASGDEGIVLVADGVDLCRIEMDVASAAGAVTVQRLTFFPSERYLELCAALAGGLEHEARHGWPILSLGVFAGPSVAGRGGVASDASPERPHTSATEAA